MLYEKVTYMCPKCSQGYFFDNADKFSTICPDCNVEMVCVGKKKTSTEQEEAAEMKWQRRLQRSITLVHCPYCNSVNTSKIKATSKVINTVIFGFFGNKRHKQWHCNSCGSNF